MEHRIDSKRFVILGLIWALGGALWLEVSKVIAVPLGVKIHEFFGFDFFPRVFYGPDYARREIRLSFLVLSAIAFCAFGVACFYLLRAFTVRGGADELNPGVDH